MQIIVYPKTDYKNKKYIGIIVQNGCIGLMMHKRKLQGTAYRKIKKILKKLLT
jgi:hypothetical protein